MVKEENRFVLLRVILILVSILGGLLIHVTFSDFFMTATSFIFGIGCGIMSWFEEDRLKKRADKGRYEVLKHVCHDLITHTRLHLRATNPTGTLECFSTLDYVLAQLRTCCLQRKEIENFNQIRAKLGNTKTTIDKACVDKNIQMPYDDALEIVGTLEVYLNNSDN